MIHSQATKNDMNINENDLNIFRYINVYESKPKCKINATSKNHFFVCNKKESKHSDYVIQVVAETEYTN